VKQIKKNSGFTLVELIMAMTVVSIILAAIATLAFAVGSANSSADDTSQFQSRIRYTTIRFGELVRNCKLVCCNSGTEVALWLSDANVADNKINPGELVYIETGAGNNQIKLLKFTPTAALASTVFTMSAITDGSAKTWLKSNCSYSYIIFVNNCSSVTFTTDIAAPFSRKLNMYFGVQRKGILQTYQCSAFLRAQAGYLLDGSGTIISSDDDM
jgi:prepilin-type N-terminal cleavage/methylation domain-containing protein